MCSAGARRSPTRYWGWVTTSTVSASGGRWCSYSPFWPCLRPGYTSARCGKSSEHPRFECFLQRCELQPLEHVSGECVGQQLTRRSHSDPPAPQIEKRGLVEAPNRCTMGALHVVGEYLELRLGIDSREIGRA